MTCQLWSKISESNSPSRPPSQFKLQICKRYQGDNIKLMKAVVFAIFLGTIMLAAAGGGSGNCCQSGRTKNCSPCSTQSWSDPQADIRGSGRSPFSNKGRNGHSRGSNQPANPLIQNPYNFPQPGFNNVPSVSPAPVWNTNPTQPIQNPFPTQPQPIQFPINTQPTIIQHPTQPSIIQNPYVFPGSNNNNFNNNNNNNVIYPIQTFPNNGNNNNYPIQFPIQTPTHPNTNFPIIQTQNFTTANLVDFKSMSFADFRRRWDCTVQALQVSVVEGVIVSVNGDTCVVKTNEMTVTVVLVQCSRRRYRRGANRFNSGDQVKCDGVSKDRQFVARDVQCLN